MTKLRNTSGNVGEALALFELGLRVVSLRGKVPLIQDWPNLKLAKEDIVAFGERHVNWGIICGDPLIVVDTDTPEAEAKAREFGIESNVEVLSGGRGRHWYF